MTETRHAFQLIHNELLEEQIEVSLRAVDVNAFSCLLSFAKLSSVSISPITHCNLHLSLLLNCSQAKVKQTLNQKNLQMQPVAPPQD